MPASSSEIMLVIRANDLASRVLRNLAGTMEGMDKTAIKAARANINRGQSMIALGAGLTAIGGAGLKFFNDSINAAADYETAARNAFTQVDNGTTSLKNLEDMGMQVAKKIPVALNDTQKALYDIFSTMDVNTAQAQMLLEGFSKAAVAGQTDVETAAKGTMRVMNAFKMGVGDVNKANDIMFQLVRKGVGTYKDFNAAIGKASPSAVRAGQSFETTAGMLAFLTRNGLSASMAATSAARSLDAVANPKFQKNLHAIGLSALDAQGNFKPMTQIIEEITAKFANMTAPEKAAALQSLFKGAGNNVQAMRFFNLVVNNDKAFNQLVGDMQNSQGVMGKAYDIMFQSPQSKVQLLTNKYDEMKVEIGQKLLPVKMKLVEVLSKLLDWWDRLPGPMKTVIIVIGAVITALTVIFGIILMVAGAIIILNTALGILEIELAPIIVPIMLIVAAFIALVAIVVLVIKYHKQIWAWMKKIWSDIWNFLKGLWKDIVDGAKSIWGHITSFFKGLWNDIWGGIKEVWNDIIDWFKKLPGRILDELKALPGQVAYALGYLIGVVIRWGIDFVKAAVEKGEELVEWFKELPGRLLKLLESAITWLVDTGKNIIHGLIHGIETIASDVWNWFLSLPARIWNFVKDAWNWLTSTGKSTSRGLLNGIIDGANDIWNWLRNLPSNLWNWLKGAGEWLWDTGKQIVQGLWNGIKNAWNDFWGWVKKMIGDFLDGIKHGLGIASPSKKMAEIGKFMMQGWRVGMDSEKARNLRSATSHAMAIASAFNRNLQLNTPVVAGYAGAGGVLYGNASGSGSTTGVGGVRAPIQIDIHTQEINPLQHAAELGAMIQNRVGS